jgi:hypothetical protein
LKKKALKITQEKWTSLLMSLGLQICFHFHLKNLHFLKKGQYNWPLM